MTKELKADSYTDNVMEDPILGKAINSCPYKLDMATYCQGYVDGYRECQKDNDWHFVKDSLPTEEKEYLIYSKEWEYEIRKFFVDVGYFECREKDNVIKWKELE